MKQNEVPNKKRVAIFTNFTNADPAYSLNRVVQDQIKMLVIHGYKPTVIVSDGFEPIEMYAHPNVTIAHIPSVPCHNEIKKDETFDDDVDKIQEKLEVILKDIDIVLTHDLIYQPACLKHNFAARRLVKKDGYKDIKWLHWIHSATSPYRLSRLLNIFNDAYLDLMKTSFPNSFYIFFNDYSVPRISNNFEVDSEIVKVVHHPIDIPGFYGFDPNVTRLIDEKKMFEADAICCYPCRLDDGKQVEVSIKTMAMLKEFDLKVRMIVIDFHSTGGEKIAYRDRLKNIAIEYGLNPQELTFTSEFCEEWNIQVPHKIVRDFMILSNVFIMPSVSESYSLVTQEAACDDKVLVLNQDFPPFRDIFGPDAIFRKYSSNIDIMNGMDGNTTTNYGPPEASEKERKSYERDYHKETAGMIAYQLRNVKSKAMQINVRKNRNLRAVFKRELEPLFFS